MKQPGRLAGALALVRPTFSAFFRDDCPSLAAAVSFYAIFSLPPLLLLLAVATGAFLDAESVHELLSVRFGPLLGPGGSDQIRAFLETASRPGERTPAAILGGVALLFGATSAFARFQTALNRAWNVSPDRGVRSWVIKRAISLAMVLTLGIFMLLSVAASAFVAALHQVAALAPVPDLGLIDGIGQLLSFGIAALLLAILFLYVPDAHVPAGTAILGGIVTAALFVAGRFAIGEYLNRADPGSVFGAASSLAALLLWLYYNANIVFLGAEFTEVWARQRGRPLGTLDPSPDQSSTAGISSSKQRPPG